MKADSAMRAGAPASIPPALVYAGALVVALHGLIHLLGFVAFWPLAEVSQLPYRTTLLDGRWDVGAGGIRVYALLWLFAAIGYVAAVLGLLARQDWWRALMLAVTVVSLVLTVLDWTDAKAGTVVDVIILAVLLLGSRVIGGA
jgi:hypothetical protein